MLDHHITPGTTGIAALVGTFEAALVGLDPHDIVRRAVTELFPGDIALTSSFGAESAVLLHMLAQVDRATPVLFLDTGKLFPETLTYRDQLVAQLGLKDVRSIGPSARSIGAEDADDFLWSSDPDRCCAIRKVAPLAHAITGFSAWMTGRKRMHGGARAQLPLVERDGAQIKINPLAAWTAADVDGYLLEHDLPRHPLVQKGFLSIGCVPCTSHVRHGENPRSGRWSGRAKSECGIHISGALGAAQQEGL